MSGHATGGGPGDVGDDGLFYTISTAKVTDMGRKVNLDGLNEFQAQEVLDRYEDWMQARIEDYLSGQLTDEITDEQAEAIEALLDPRSK